MTLPTCPAQPSAAAPVAVVPAQRKRAPETRRRAARPVPGFAPTSADVALLAHLSRYRYGTVATVAYATCSTHGTARWRLDRLVRAGMLTRVSKVWRGETVYIPTPGGRRASGTGLGRPSGGSPDLPAGLADATVGHTLQVALLGIFLEQHGILGCRVVTEREIRQADQQLGRGRRGTAGTWAPVAADGGRHFPDLVIEMPDGVLPWAVEWEARAKNDRDLRRALDAYGRSRTHLKGVVYVCSTEAIAARVRAVGAELVQRGRLVVWGPAEYGLDPATGHPTLRSTPNVNPSA